MSTSPLLEVQLRAGYGRQTTLQRVEFSLEAGERLGLVGTSGAGKSTLLLALLGLLPWRGGWVQGEVRVAGVDLLAMKERQARRIRGKVLALVPQSPASALNSALSLETHFREAWRAHEAADEARLRSRREALLARVHLPSDRGFLARKPGEISVGQAQRCALALALLHRPALLVADEPTSALDPVTQIEVLQLLREISAAEGTSLLFVSHDLLSLFRICERVALLHQGHIAADVPMTEIAQVQHPEFLQLLKTLPVPAEVLLRHNRDARVPEQESRIGTEVMTPVP